MGNLYGSYYRLGKGEKFPLHEWMSTEKRLHEAWKQRDFEQFNSCLKEQLFINTNRIWIKVPIECDIFSHNICSTWGKNLS